MSKSDSCHIGTSGWNYKHWMGPFYPKDTPQKKLLDHYRKHFKTVEVNNSFYQLPAKNTLIQWRKAVGENFVFSVKASRYITHMKKLKNPQKSLSKFLSVIRNLEGRLGPILFQLPPKWRINKERLEAFLAALPTRHSYTFEFRDKSWFDEDVYELLSRYNSAFCIYDLEGSQSPEVITSDFVYIRLHGPSRNAYEGSYCRKKLKTWAGKFDKWSKNSKEIYCYFDNDQNGYAPKNAYTLQNIVNS